MIKPEHPAFIETPEGNIEVLVVKIEGDRAWIVWNEQSMDSVLCVTGQAEEIPLTRLKSFDNISGEDNG